MSMFCYQCQEAAKNTGCTVKGVCGKDEETSGLHDLLVHVLKGISLYAEKGAAQGTGDPETGRFITAALFATITNANFDSKRIHSLIREGLILKLSLLEKYGEPEGDADLDAARWNSNDTADFLKKSRSVGILSTADEDARSLRELLIYGLKGIAAYAHHAYVLGKEDQAIYDFLVKGLASTVKNLGTDMMIGLVLQAGDCAVKTMALLDGANTSAFGNPEITSVSTGVRKNPGILISGHDLKDLMELLEQAKDTGVDVYTHSEMLPAHYYPAFKKFTNFAGNYGGSWWQQSTEFESFNGPILMTTNCITPVKDSYRDRIFTTGLAGYPGVKHIPDRTPGGKKDFSAVIALAKKCPSPVELENGEIVGGFAHNQVFALADKVVDAVKSGAIKRFVVMAGCDGRHKSREYFTDVARELPSDTVILTAGCAKYRYNKLALGDIGGIPRVLDAGQCNDSYSLAVIALKLKEVFGLDDVNKLPLSFDLGWYEQKAVTVLLALLSLGFKGIKLGPTLPAFLSPGVAKVLVENFNISPTGSVKEDIEKMMKGQ
jgi:hydroxylamine reductase